MDPVVLCCLSLVALCGLVNAEEIWYGPSPLGQCYVVETTKGDLSYLEARTYCESLDAYIPTLANTLTAGQEAEIFYAYGNARTQLGSSGGSSDLWLGYKATSAGSWMAENGMPIGAWNYWASNDASGGKTCTKILTTNKWNTELCTSKNKVVCQKEVECTVVTPANAVVTPADVISFKPQEKMNFQCNPGYKHVGPTSSTCDCDGSWKEPLPTCELITCKTFGVSNAVLTPEQLKLLPGEGIDIVCNEGYVLEGPARVTCEIKIPDIEAGWDVAVPYCRLVKCHYFAEPYRGSVTYSREPLTPGTVAKFGCEEGYILESIHLQNITCGRVGDFGEWMGKAPVCVLKCPYYTLFDACYTTGSFVALAAFVVLLLMYCILMLYKVIVGPRYAPVKEPEKEE